MSLETKSHEVRVPTMGESIVEATVSRWLKKEGEPISQGEPIVEVESEKANLEIPAEASGTLEKILKQPGENVRVGEVLATIRPGALGSGTASPPRTASLEQVQPPSQAATQTPARPAEGKEEGGATPIARKMAERYGIDPGQVRGTGPQGRVTREDVEAHVELMVRAAPAQPPLAAPRPADGQRAPGDATQAPAAPPISSVPQAPEPSPARATPQSPTGRYEERVRLSRRLLTMARRMAEANQTAAMATTYNEVDMSRVMEIRKQHRPAFKERHGIDLGFMSFFVKASIQALKAFPRFNAEMQGEELLLKYYYDIGIAVGVEDGLVVPVLRDADRKTFAEIEETIAGVAQRARDRKLTLEELTGGTFTITNGGVFGSLWSTPILNLPQTGILGMHRIEERPVVRDGQVVVRPMMYLALTYDHRIVEGREAVLFLVRIKELIEDPTRLLLET